MTSNKSTYIKINVKLIKYIMTENIWLINVQEYQVFIVKYVNVIISTKIYKLFS